MTEAAEGRGESAGTARRALLAFEYPGMADFDDPELEWRRLFSEVLGTFFLVLAGAGAARSRARTSIPP